MKRRTSVLAAAILVVAGSDGLAPAVGNAARAPKPFATANVHFEQNATDGDVEVVFEIKGGADGLVGLTAVGPDGRTVISFEAPDASTLGLRQFRFESPEPKDVASLKSAYPEGAYTFAGWTAGGDTLGGESTLSHRLPAPATFVQPRAEAKDVPTKGLVITWPPVKDISAYIVKIEQDDLGENIAARIPAAAPQFVVPAGFLRAGTEYQLGIGTVSDKGNISFVETTFTTAGSSAADAKK
jgi:hypothetical protein